MHSTSRFSLLTRHRLYRFADRIQPWVHYVPIAYDYSDLYDAFVFFRGDISGAGNHDELAKKIALAGSKWAATFWRPEDATAYMFRCVSRILIGKFNLRQSKNSLLTPD